MRPKAALMWSNAYATPTPWLAQSLQTQGEFGSGQRGPRLTRHAACAPAPASGAGGRRPGPPGSGPSALAAPAPPPPPPAGTPPGSPRSRPPAFAAGERDVRPQRAVNHSEGVRGQRVPGREHRQQHPVPGRSPHRRRSTAGITARSHTGGCRLESIQWVPPWPYPARATKELRHHRHWRGRGRVPPVMAAKH